LLNSKHGVNGTPPAKGIIRHAEEIIHSQGDGLHPFSAKNARRNEVKRTTINSTLFASFILLAFINSPVFAEKPQEVIERSNGYPRGMHFNLNIHGTSWKTCNAVSELDGHWGNSIHIPEDGIATIECIFSKKASLTELTVLDPCAGFDGVTDTVRVQLPHTVLVNGAPTNADGYYVFARLHGKYNNWPGCNGLAKDCPASSITLYPDVITQACRDDFGPNKDCLWALGLITQQATYLASPEGFERLDRELTKAKGKESGVQDITRLFAWSGWIFYSGSPDTNGDTVVDDMDIPADAVTHVADLDGSSDVSLYEWKVAHADFNGDGVVNQFDLDAAYTEAPAGLSPDAYVPNAGGNPALVDSYDWRAYHADSNGDGLITEHDILPGAEFFVAELEDDSSISIEEWLAYQESINTCVYYGRPIWIFDVADIVVSRQDVDNTEPKLLQIIFFPKATTEYSASGYILVDKITEPRYDPQLFDFTLTGGPANIFRTFQIRDRPGLAPYESGRVMSGSYTITEAELSGWNLTDIVLVDPDGESCCSTGPSVTIDVDPGEEVLVLFKSTKR
jgi:hypothetical protein